MKKAVLFLSVILMIGLLVSVVKANTSETQTPPPANSNYMIKVIEVPATKSGTGETLPETTVQYNLSATQAKAAIAAATGTPVSNVQNIFSDTSSKISFSVYTNAQGIASTAKPKTGFSVTTRKPGYSTAKLSMTTNPNTYSVAIVRLKKI